MEVRVGTAGWALPQPLRDRFAPGASLLARYASRFDAVEITSSFYRPHRASTYARWAASVPPRFRFALKLPRAISHDKRLRDASDDLLAFLDVTATLGDRRDVLLVQLAPKHTFDFATADAFFAAFRKAYGGRIACEPRHHTWFERDADATLAGYDVARVAADPAAVPAAAHPGRSGTFRYVRLHGAPAIYRSSYDAERITEVAR